MKAWLITWKITAPSGSDNTIVSILSSRLSPDSVKDYVERIYIDKCFSFSERLSIVRNKKNNPYPAEFPKLPPLPKGPGGRFTGQVTCGHNPHLFARPVSDIKVRRNENGDEELTWTEPPTLDEESDKIMEKHGFR